jgi:hypothetical protein
MAVRVSNTRVLVPADLTKLDGIEALADVTDAANVAAAGAVMDADFAGTTLGRMTRTGVGTYAVVQDNLVAAVDPVVGDDVAAGYGVDSIWINTTAVPRRIFKCLNPAAGAAVWRQLNAQNNLAAVIAPTVNDDTTLGYDISSVWVDTVLRNTYTCISAAAGAAIWDMASSTEHFDSRQVTPADEDIRCFRATAPGIIIAGTVEAHTVVTPADTEALTFDIMIDHGGVIRSALTAAYVIDATYAVGDTPVALTIDLAQSAYVAGDLIFVRRSAYNAGAGPSTLENTTVDFDFRRR